MSWFDWIPACAGMTDLHQLTSLYFGAEGRIFAEIRKISAKNEHLPVIWRGKIESKRISFSDALRIRFEIIGNLSRFAKNNFIR